MWPSPSRFRNRPNSSSVGRKSSSNHSKLKPFYRKIFGQVEEDDKLRSRGFLDGKTKVFDLFFVSSPQFRSDPNSVVPIHPLTPSISVSPSGIRVFDLSSRYFGMANTGTDDHHEESSPLLSKQVEEDGSKESCNEKDNQPKEGKVDAAPDLPDVSVGVGYGWTAEGLPLGHGSVVGEPMARGQWDSSLCACLGRNDEFCSSDLEVCLLGSMAPCVLYGSNAERLLSGPGTFANHCLPYCGLYLIGQSFFGCNLLAPWFSYPSRTAMRRKFNLEGSCEALSRSCGCCGSYLEDEVQREQCESVCDFATHVFCHLCALCQEGREIRRRIPHPGFNAQPVLVMIPPGEQTMGRGA